LIHRHRYATVGIAHRGMGAEHASAMDNIPSTARMGASIHRVAPVQRELLGDGKQSGAEEQDSRREPVDGLRPAPYLAED